MKTQTYYYTFIIFSLTFFLLEYTIDKDNTQRLKMTRKLQMLFAL